MIITQNGVMIRMAVGGISTVGRNTQGVRVINLDEGDRVIDMTRLPKSEDDAPEEEGTENGEMVENGSAPIAENGAEVVATDATEAQPEEPPQGED
jgi:DNA gyrase subunit A